jgi:ADP-heptose:LPS heptosyltransferase
VQAVISTEAPLPPATEVRFVTALMLGEIGDLVVTTPTLAALRKAYPAARMQVVIRRQLARLLAADPMIDELLLYDASSRWTQLRFLADLALRRHDLWVDLHTPTFNTVCGNDQVFRRNRVFMLASHPRFQRAFSMPAYRGRLSHPVAVPAESVLRTENIVDLTLRLAGRGIHDRSKRLEISAVDAEWAGAEIERQGLAEQRCVGLFFGANQPAKVWPAPRTLEFCRALPARFPGVMFLLLVGPQEREAIAQLVGQLDASTAARFRVFTAGGLGGQAALMRHCEAMVSTDSGPMHMADALGVPIVALFSAFNHLPIWRPLHAVAVLHTAGLPCSPCLSSDCHNGQACMLGIAPTHVLDSLEQALAAAA